MPDDDFFSPFRQPDAEAKKAEAAREAPVPPPPDTESASATPATPNSSTAPKAPVHEEEEAPHAGGDRDGRADAAQFEVLEPQQDAAALQEKIRSLESKMDRLNSQLERWSSGVGSTNPHAPLGGFQPWLVPALGVVLVVVCLYFLFVDVPHREQVARDRAAAEAQRGGLRVDAAPSGATVTVGGEAAATAPAHISSLRTGVQKVVVSAEGYEPVTLTAEIRAGEFSDLGKVILRPATGSLKITSPLQATTYQVVIKADQTPIPLVNPPQGVLPATLDLPVGAYSVVLRAKGFPDKSLDVEIKRGEIKTLAWEGEFGSVAIVSAPAPVELEVNGQAMGSSPLRLQLPVGEHKVVARRKGWPDDSRILQVIQGKEVALSFNVAPAEVEILSDPPGATIRMKQAEGAPAAPSLGETPARLQAPPAPLEYELSLQGYKPEVVTTKPAAGEKVTLRAVLHKKKPPQMPPQRGENFVMATPAATDSAADSAPKLGEVSSSSSSPGATQVAAVATSSASLLPSMAMVWVPSLQLWVGKYEVTQEEYEKLMQTNPSTSRGTRRPVENVAWADAARYCAKLTENAKAAGLLPEGFVYRLPTDAEYTLYVGDASLDVSVTSRDFRRKGTEEVGSKGPNEFGLYDVRGNVWEWADDWYDAVITRQEPHPSNPQGGRKFRVLRGASWEDRTAENLDVRSRGYAEPEGVDSRFGRRYGFRVVLAPPLPAPSDAAPASPSSEVTPLPASTSVPVPPSPSHAPVPEKPAVAKNVTSPVGSTSTNPVLSPPSNEPTPVKSPRDFEVKPQIDIDPVNPMASPDFSQKPRGYQPSAP